MLKKIFNTNDLIDKQIQDLYVLHNQIYYRRGNGLNFNQWRQNLIKSYHHTTSKKVHITTDKFSKIKSYSIFTTPICINGIYWSKILEGGVLSTNNQNDFIDMLVDLIENHWNIPIWFFGETSLESILVLKLMKKSGFTEANDILIIEDVLSSLLKTNEFDLYESDGIIVKRKTRLTDNYTGKIILKEGGIVKEAYKEEKNTSIISMEV